MLKGLVILIAYLFVGETISGLAELRIPGPVLGMLLLFISLRLSPWPIFVHHCEGASQPLIKFLPLFFLPAGAGIFFLPPAVLAQWPAILAAMVGGTLISLVLCSLLIRRLAKRNGQ